MQLNAELFRALSEITDNETLMTKAVKYIKKLAAKKKDSTLMSKEEFMANIDKAEKQYEQGKYTEMLPGEDLAAHLKRVAAVQKDIDKIDKEILAIDDKIIHATDIIEEQVYADMHYDPVSYADQTIEIDNIDWGKKDAFGERDIPSFNDFVVGKMAAWVKAQGGTATAGKGVMKFTLPNGDTELSISKYQYDGPFSIKQKNAWTPTHNFAVDRFVDWMNAEHVSKVQKAVADAKTLAGDMVSKLQDERKAKMSDRQKKADELKNLQNVDPNSGIWAAVCDLKSNSDKGKILLSIQGGRVTRYLFTKKPSDLIPFKGNFPILEDYQMSAFYKEIQKHMYLDECPEWVQKAVLKGEQIYLIDTSFSNYLKKSGLSDKFNSMKAADKATILVNFLDNNSLGLERLNIN